MHCINFYIRKVIMKNIPTAPINVVYVKIQKKVYDSVRFPSGTIIYKDTSFHPEESSMCEATVVSVCPLIQDRFDYAGMRADMLQPGDTILIRYDVVFHYSHQPERDTPIWKNIIVWNGEEYWRVDIQQIFGILRKGYVEMINGYVMCDPCTIRADFGSFGVPRGFEYKLSNELYKIRYVGEPLPQEPKLEVTAGDIIHIRPGLAQNYQTDWGDFSIIKQSHILAREQNIA